MRIVLLCVATIALAACAASPTPNRDSSYYGSNYAPYSGTTYPPATSCSQTPGLVGGLAGAAGGGLLGNQFGKGTGKGVATGVGVVGGGAAGYEAGRSLSGC
jgi:outer membrane lipoprotein SlyB